MENAAKNNKIHKACMYVCMYVYVLIDTQHSGLLLVSSKNCIFLM